CHRHLVLLGSWGGPPGPQPAPWPASAARLPGSCALARLGRLPIPHRRPRPSAVPSPRRQFRPEAGTAGSPHRRRPSSPPPAVFPRRVGCDRTQLRRAPVLSAGTPWAVWLVVLLSIGAGGQDHVAFSSTDRPVHHGPPLVVSSALPGSRR